MAEGMQGCGDFRGENAEADSRPAYHRGSVLLLMQWFDTGVRFEIRRPTLLRASPSLPIPQPIRLPWKGPTNAMKAAEREHGGTGAGWQIWLKRHTSKKHQWSTANPDIGPPTTPTIKWKQMARIPDQLLRSIVFIYPDADTAGRGLGAGGTGFLVSVQGASRAEPFMYLVTNAHVALGEDRYVRIPRISGEPEIVEIEGANWVSHPDGDDVAACHLERRSYWDVDGMAWHELAASPDRLSELYVGVGDEVFMLGRFVSHQGKQRTQPLARFGNIAMMPGERVVDARGFAVEAFLIEMRSLSGFSGSPVFLHLGPGAYRGDGRMMPVFSETIGLIGIDSGHKTLRARVVQRDSGRDAELDVDLNTGVAIVVPTWRIKEVLNESRFVAERGAAVPEHR